MCNALQSEGPELEIVRKKYSDTFGRSLKIAVRQVVGQIRQFVELWEPEELQVPIESEEEDARKKAVLDMEQEATVLVDSATTNKIHYCILVGLLSSFGMKCGRSLIALF